MGERIVRLQQVGPLGNIRVAKENGLILMRCFFFVFFFCRQHCAIEVSTRKVLHGGVWALIPVPRPRRGWPPFRFSPPRKSSTKIETPHNIVELFLDDSSWPRRWLRLLFPSKHHARDAMYI